MAEHEASMVLEQLAQPLAGTTPSNAIPKEIVPEKEIEVEPKEIVPEKEVEAEPKETGPEKEVEAELKETVPEKDVEAETLQLALVTPPNGNTERLRPRTSTPTYYPDDDNSVGHSRGSAKTVWNQQDILDLIDAVQTVELGQLLSETSRKSKSGQGRQVVAGTKWEQVAARLPNCWMSSSDRFHVICRGKFQELRRNYQAVLRDDNVCKFFTKEVCLRMKDYIEEVPPLHFFEGTDNLERPNMVQNGSTGPITNPTPKIKSKRGRKKKIVEDIKSKSPKHTSSDSANRQLLRRSPRVPKRSCKLEEEEDEEVQPHKRTSSDSRTSRTRSGEGNVTNGEVKRKGVKRARFDVEEEDDEEEDQPENLDQTAKSISEIFKQNFELLRANIDFSLEFHLHKHLHKHFNQFEERMTGLIEKVDRKIERLDRKIESKLMSSSK